MPDLEERRSYALRLAQELEEFERPMPVMDEYDLLLGDKGVVRNPMGNYLPSDES